METTALAPMTELEAVNDMLSLIGESPVASLSEASGVADAQIALQLLRRESRAVQQSGWDWNTETEYRLAPNNDGEIILPPNTIKVDASDPQHDYIFRDGKLWDRTNKTFKINKAVYLDIVFVLPFNELPNTARRYISLLAGRKFENRMQGDSESNQINERDVMEARADLIDEECENADLNVVKDSPTIRRIAMRRRA